MTWFIACLCDKIRTEVFVLRTVAALQYVAHYLVGVAHFLFCVRPKNPQARLTSSSLYILLFQAQPHTLKSVANRGKTFLAGFSSGDFDPIPYCSRDNTTGNGL